MGFRNSCFLFVVTSLCACSEQIQQGLDERQANEVQTVLLEQGIDARKMATSGKKPTWAIEVPRDQASDAIRILNQEQLPRPKPPELAESNSLVPTPAEERNRLMARLSVEISQTLEAVDGVISARVHVVVPPAPRLGQPPGPSKASVFLRVRKDHAARLSAMKSDLRSLVAGGVENLKPEDVSLVVSEVAHIQRGHAKALGVKSWVMVMLGTFLLMGAAFIGLLAIRQKQGASLGRSLWVLHKESKHEEAKRVA